VIADPNEERRPADAELLRDHVIQRRTDGLGVEGQRTAYRKRRGVALEVLSAST
jgi:hypothetical protein